MATQWYFKSYHEEFGPVRFRELVLLVRHGVLTETDWVRPHYTRSWQQADTVVGLFHMARRADEPFAVPETAAAESESISPDVDDDADGPPPIWVLRLLETRSRQATNRPIAPPTFEPPVAELASAVPPELEESHDATSAKQTGSLPSIADQIPEAPTEHQPLEAGYGKGIWSKAMHEALGAVDARRAAANRPGFLRRLSQWSGRTALRMVRGAPLPRFARDPYVCTAAALILGLNVLWYLLQPEPIEPDRKRIDKVSSILAQVQQKRASKPTDAEWQQFVAQLNSEVEPLLTELNQDDEPTRLCLRWALEYRLPKVLKYGRYRYSYSEAAYEHLLQEANRQLKKRS